MSAQVTITQLPIAAALDGSESVPIVQNGRTVRTNTGSIGNVGAVTLVATGAGLTGGPITSTGTISIANTAVTAGSYTLANITVNAQGQITSASNGTAGVVSSFSGGTTGLTPSTPSAGDVVLAGQLNVANGGSGANSLTGYLVGNGSSAFTAVASIPNAGLTNSSITVNGSSISLGGSGTVTATASNALTIGTGLTGTSYNGSSAVTIAIDSTVATLTGTQTLTNKTISGSSNTLTNIANGSLTNSSVTVGSTSVSLGATASALTGLASVAVTADPTTALQLATKQYVDGLVATGLTYHQPVQATTTASLASITGGTVTYNNGASGVGATITLSVALTVLDGYTIANTNRLLIKNEVNQAYNGVYTWATGGTVLTRATDADTYGPGTTQLSLNDYFFTQNGTVNKGTSYVVTTTGTITFGTTAITFAEFSSSQVYTGTSPINVSGTVISLTTVPATLGGTGTATVTTGDLLYGSGTNAWSKLALGAAYKSLVVNSAGGQVEWNAVALNQSAAVSGALGIANGGTNATATPTAGGSAYGTGTAYAFTAAGTAGQVLLSNGSSAPTWSGVSGGTF